MVVERVRDFLVPYDRPVRRDLRSWAEELTTYMSSPEIQPREVATALNNAALVFTYLGERDTARWLCGRQLEWVARIARDDDSFLALGLQPWVNLGRLKALEGRHAEAREHFAIWSSAHARLPLSLGPCQIGAAHWTRLLGTDHMLASVLSNVLVIDSLKSCFAEGDYHAALTLLARFDRSSLSTPVVTFHEADLVCQVELGHHLQALELATGWTYTDRYSAAIVGLHLVRSLWALGHRAGAEECGVQLAAAIGWPVDSRVELTASLRFLDRLTETLAALGLVDLALQVGEAYLDRARDVDDQVGMHRALRLLLGVVAPGSGHERRLRAEKATLEEVSDYKTIRTSASSPRPVARDVYERLAGAVAAAAQL